jgi:hypothetical protein
VTKLLCTFLLDWHHTQRALRITLGFCKRGLCVSILPATQVVLLYVGMTWQGPSVVKARKHVLNPGGLSVINKQLANCRALQRFLCC